MCVWHKCGQSFTTNSCLKRHQTIHLGLKPFKCEFNEYEKTFSHKSNYKHIQKVIEISNHLLVFGLNVDIELTEEII